MERDLDNANPTILSVSQLPSRSRKGAAARRGPDSKCDSIVYPKHHWPYGANSSSDEDEGYGEEPVDEQDIYGTCRYLPSERVSPLSNTRGGVHNTWGQPAVFLANSLTGSFLLLLHPWIAADALQI
jgi:hypothetical protein